jgi:glycosyltransferase involved in cell wall biosynthesis
MTPLTVVVAHNRYRERGGEDAVVDAEIGLLRAYGHRVIEYRRDNAELDPARGMSLLQQTLWSQSVAREVGDVIRKERPSVIHVHNTFPLLSPSIYWAASRARVPVVQTLHNFRLLCPQAMFLRHGKVCEDCLGELPWRGVTRKCYRNSTAQSAALAGMLCLHRGIGTYRRKVSRYIALSEFSRAKFIAGGLPAQQISVKPNFVAGVEPDDAGRDGGLFVGRLSPEKGLQTLIGALRLLPEISCEVFGTGPQLESAQGEPQLRLHGQQSTQAVLERMRTASFLVMPSICYEQFPRTLVEAFACGLPVIASRLGPLAELVQDGRTGLLFTPGSAAELAEKIRFASTCPQAMREMGRNARREYEAKYTPQRNHEQLMEVYHAAMHS